MKRRVVITGVGPITPIGIGKDEFWGNLIAGKSGIGLITQFDASDPGFTTKIAGEVKDFDFANYGDKKEGKRMDRVTQFAVAAAKLAVEDAELDLEKIDPVRAGVCVGSGIGGIHTFLEQSLKYGEKGPGKISPFFIPMEIPNMPAGQISIALGFKGPNTAIITACATGTNCIGDALRTIQYGDADVMVAGGAEGAVCTLGMGGFAAMKALSTRNDDPATASRPWDKGRDGFVMGEGAGVVVLEELEHAKKRGAKIYAELVGFGMSSDAYHITAPNVDGPALAVTRALKDAGLNAADVDYVNAHGTSTPLGDANETNALKLALGEEHARKVVVNSTKSMTGHLLGAAGGVEAVYSILAVHHQKSPPTINIFEQDIEGGCDLDYCANEARDVAIDVAISNSFGFGGTNGTLVFRKV